MLRSKGSFVKKTGLFVFSVEWITRENPNANRQPENTWRRRQVLSGKPIGITSPYVN
jgi:hypothetical protein